MVIRLYPAVECYIKKELKVFANLYLIVWITYLGKDSEESLPKRKNVI